MIIKNLRAACGLMLVLAAVPGHAQWTPKTLIRMVVPFPAGGVADVTARHLANKMTRILGQNVIVDNRGGMNGMLGAQIVVKAKPDGYTLLLPTSSTVAINPVVYPEMRFNPITDLAPVTPVIGTPMVLVVTPSLPARNVKEFIAIARTRPGELAFASGGTGNIMHFALELFRDQARINVTHVPYKGGAPAVADVIGGHSQAVFVDIPLVTPHLQSGRLRGLAVAGAERNALFPNIPSMKELGYPQVVVKNWYAVFAPAGTPKEIVDRLNEVLHECLAAPEVRDRLVELGAEIFTLSAEEFGKFLRTEIERWRGVVAKYGVRLAL